MTRPHFRRAALEGTMFPPAPPGICRRIPNIHHRRRLPSCVDSLPFSSSRAKNVFYNRTKECPPPACPLSLMREKGTIGPRLAPSHASKESFRLLHLYAFQRFQRKRRLFATDQGAVLVDCGMSGRQCWTRCAPAGPAGFARCSSRTSTATMSRAWASSPAKFGLPVYATEGTWQGMEAPWASSRRTTASSSARASFFLNDLEVAPFSIRTMQPGPWATASCAGPQRGRGHGPGHFQDVRDAVTGADLVLLESNHDPDLLRQNPIIPSGSKPAFWQKRPFEQSKRRAGRRPSGQNGTPPFAAGAFEQREQHARPGLSHRARRPDGCGRMRVVGRDASCGGALPGKLSLHHGIRRTGACS